MSNAADYGENKIMNTVFGNTALGLANYDFGLLTNSTFTDGGSPTEPVGNGYARVSKTNNKETSPAAGDGTFTAAAAGVVNNAQAIQFPQASGGNWGTVYYVAIFEGSTNNLIAYAPITGGGVTINAGTQFTINIGDLTLTLD